MKKKMETTIGSGCDCFSQGFGGLGGFEAFRVYNKAWRVVGLRTQRLVLKIHNPH